MSGSTITTTLSHGVSLGSAAYSSPLTITSTGAVDPTTIAPGETAAVYGDGIVINDGTILSGNGASAASLTGISLFGGITNNGLIGGGIYIPASYSSITNFGTISGFATNGSGVSVSIDAGGTGETITNFGTIIGGVGMYSGTVINAGTIDGNGGYAIHSVTDFQGFKLVVEPGAVFIGDVIPGSEVEPNVILELAGTSTTALSGIGTSFQNFNKLSFATGAAWTAEGSLGGLEIDGFTFNDTLVLDGFAATSDTYVAGAGLELSDGAVTETLDITGNFSTSIFAISRQSGQTTIALTDPPHTISTTVTTSVTLNSGGYTSPLTITSTGAIDPVALGANALTAAAGAVTNQGAITGGFGAASTGTPQYGGIGAVLTGATLINTGAITGGQGGGGNPGGRDGGYGVSLGAGSFSNSGTITGGAGAFDGGAGGRGAAGARLTGGSATNSGAIIGGLGGGATYGAVGLTSGVGLDQQAGVFLNTGTLRGGASNNALKPGNAGVGVDLGGGTLTNANLIAGGGGTYGNIGATIFGGTLDNTGAIAGGSGASSAGAGVKLVGGTLLNAGNISGGHYATASSGYDPSGVYLSGLGVGENTGTITGGGGGGEVHGGSGVVVTSNGSFNNSGTVNGGAGLQTGGNGAYFTGGTFVNAGSLVGGAGKLSAGDGAVVSAVTFSTQTGLTAAGTFSNQAGGVITGGAATRVAQGFGGAAGIGLHLTGGAVQNAGNIAGGAGYGNLSGGAGIAQSGGTLSNTGTIAGGLSGGDAVNLGGGFTYEAIFINSGVVRAGAPNPASTGAQAGAAGISLGSYAVLTNTGTIIGGEAGTGGTGGHGIQSISGRGFGGVNNSGTIIGGAGATGGTAVDLYGDNFTNSGTIIGGAGATGGTGVYMYGVGFTNSGTVESGQGATAGAAPGATLGDAVKFGSHDATLIVDPGAVFIGNVAANAAARDELQLASASTAGTLDMGGSFSGFTTIAFAGGAGWDLSGTTMELSAGEKVLGFKGADTLNLEGFAATAHTYVAGTGLELSNGTTTETIDLIGNFSTGSFIVLDQPTGTEIQLCYLRGTHILTPVGEVPVEAIAIGDAIITRFNGYRRVKWIGRQSFGRRFIAANRAQLPIRIAAGALGANLPKRDLFVSPGHSMLIGNILVLASNLINGVTITQNRCPDEVHYYQLEFETHDCVLAEGCWSESFCDYADLRNQFHNVADFHSLYPNHVTPTEHLMCAPRPAPGPLLQATLRPIAAHAASFAASRVA